MERELAELGYTGFVGGLTAEEIVHGWTQKGWIKISPDGWELCVPDAGREQFAKWDEEGQLWEKGTSDEIAMPTWTFYRSPREHHKHLKSTNLLERLNQELKRRTHVVRIFPNETSCLRLIRALACEQHEEWLDGPLYLDLQPRREQLKPALQIAAEMPPQNRDTSSTSAH